ncbi:hypothetical protein [Nocardia sp. NPDC050175]|uniref:hypothetical protein n=1 Tax=Nocardia sp. NPDC050175 TaxID=3364317 RepID=UPI00379B718C
MSAVSERFGIVHETGVFEGADDDGTGRFDEDAGAANHPAESPSGDLDPEVAEKDSEFAAYSVGEASLRGGEIVVTATDSGIPLSVRVTQAQLRRDPNDLGDDVLRLCRLAADRAGLSRRTYLAELGFDERTMNLLGLPTPAAVERSELVDEAERSYEPRSWLEQDGDQW